MESLKLIVSFDSNAAFELRKFGFQSCEGKIVVCSLSENIWRFHC